MSDYEQTTNNDKLAKIIEIEGTDRSGKETQSKLLKSYLEEKGYTVLLISFPNYDSLSSRGIKEYLTGEYGEINDINEFQASSLFAYDRMITYFKDIQYAIRNNDFIIFDRYVGSNLIHQAGKITYKNATKNIICGDSIEELHKFLMYWYDYEYNKLGLPKPTMTILLDMPVTAGIQIAKNRKNKINNSDKQDIYESNIEYMNCAYHAAKLVATYFGWNVIKCTTRTLFKKEKIKSISTIHHEIVNLIKELL